jgi:hypothetical protein
MEFWVIFCSCWVEFIGIYHTPRCGSTRRIYPYVPMCHSANLDRRGVVPAQYDSTVLDDEGKTLKHQLKQLHRWSWPLRELSSLIDTQQRHLNSKFKPREEWRNSQLSCWPVHIHAFIPGLFRIISCLQGFCNPANAAGMPFGLNGIGAMVDQGGWDEAAGNTPSDESGNKTIRDLVNRLQKNVRNARDHA